jgi:hypothetical protein
MALDSTQPLTKMSTRNLPWSKRRPAGKVDNLAAIYGRMSEKVRASVSHNPKGLYDLYRDNFIFTIANVIELKYLGKKVTNQNYVHK